MNLMKLPAQIKNLKLFLINKNTTSRKFNFCFHLKTIRNCLSNDRRAPTSDNTMASMKSGFK